MEIRVATLRKMFALIGLLFYCGFISFFFRVLAGGAGGESQSADVEGNAVNQLLGLGIMAVCLFLGFRRKLLVTAAFWRHNWMIALFVGFIFLSFVWSVESAITLKRSIALLAVVAFALYLTQMYSIEQLFRTLGLLFGAAATIGLIWAVIAPGKAFVAGGLREGAFIGMFADKNGGARVYVMAILMLLPFSLNRDRWAIAASVACLLGLALAQSASGIMLLVIGGTTAFYLAKLSGRTNIQLNATTVILGLSVYAVVAVAMALGYQFVLELLGRDPSLTDRTLIWELIIPLMLDKFLLGYGFGAFWAGWGAEDFIERWGYIGNAHNGYLEILLHGGIVFFSLFVVMTLGAVLALFSRLIRTTQPMVAAVSIALLLQMLVANYIAYALPNYRAYDFFIYMIVVFAAVNTWREPRRAGEKGL